MDAVEATPFRGLTYTAILAPRASFSSGGDRGTGGRAGNGEHLEILVPQLATILEILRLGVSLLSMK